MVDIRLREGERFTHEPCVGLAQRIVPPLHMTGLSAGLVHAPVSRAGKPVAISFPTITHTPTAFIRPGNAAPQLTAGLFTAIPQGKGHNLSGAPTQRRPQPALPFPRPDKAPHLIQLQLIARSRWQQGVLDAGSLRRFFLTIPPGFAAPPQRPAQSRACWGVRNTPPRSGSSRLRYRAPWDSRPRSAHTPYSDIAASPWDYARFSQCRDSDSGDTDA
jgi:hypothetical protein